MFRCRLLLIKHFGATVAEIVKSCRAMALSEVNGRRGKVTTICISFLVFGKPWNGAVAKGFQRILKDSQRIKGS